MLRYWIRRLWLRLRFAYRIATIPHVEGLMILEKDDRVDSAYVEGEKGLARKIKFERRKVA